MFRAAAWVGGLFAVGGGIAHFFPGQFTEPVILMALGATLFLISGRVRPDAVSDTETSDTETSVAETSSTETTSGAETSATRQGTVAPASRITR